MIVILIITVVRGTVPKIFAKILEESRKSKINLDDSMTTFTESASVSRRLVATCSSVKVTC